MSRYFHPRYATLEAYVPGEQPRDRQYIKLNTNESPYPPSEGVIRAIDRAEVEALRLYSDPTAKALREKLGEVYDISADCVYVANGSDDILNFAFMAFGADGVAFPSISYGFYSVFADLHGISAEMIPLKEDFTVSAEDYCNKNKMIVIANPNAPTGLTLSLSEIERILQTNPDHVVLIDEAYVDFGADTCMPLLERYDNLLVVGTFSKSRSMAGARLGFGFGSAELIEDLEKLKYSTNPYNLNRLTQLAGVVALQENAYYMENCKKIAETREYTAAELRNVGFFVTASQANFLFAKSDAIHGRELYEALRARGILVRHFSREEISEFNRITVGSREEMEAFLAAVKEIIKEKSKQ